MSSPYSGASIPFLSDKSLWGQRVILKNGATLGGYKKGCKGPDIDAETAKQLANTGCDTHWELGNTAPSLG